MRTRLAIKCTYGEFSYPKGFHPKKDFRVELAKFLETHKDEFTKIKTEKDIESQENLVALIKADKYGVCVIKIFGEDIYYLVTEDDYLCSYSIVEIKEDLYWLLDDYDSAESIRYFKIKPGSYQLEEVIE